LPIGRTKLFANFFFVRVGKAIEHFLLLWGDLAKAVVMVTPTHQSRNGSTIFREKKEDRKSFPPAAL
jgi:hypothetical protein